MTLGALTGDYTVKLLDGVVQPCAIPCAVCAGEIGPSALQVAADVENLDALGYVITFTRLVCSEGCAIRFVSDPLPTVRATSVADW